MIMKVIDRLLRDVAWGDLDVLLFDMPQEQKFLNQPPSV